MTVSTDISSLKGTITYLHHQCSNTETDLTYTDATVGASGAAAVNETTVNGVTVSTTQGGCYTTPYYYYYEEKTTQVTNTYLITGYTYAGRVNDSNGNSHAVVNQIVVKTMPNGGPGYRGVSLYEEEARSQYPIGSTFSETSTSTNTVYSYGTTYQGTLVNTYYLKTCNHTNGEVLSATITY